MTRWSVQLTALLAAVSLAAPAWAASHHRAGKGHWGEQQVFRLQLGSFTPDGSSSYWQEKTIDFTGDADDFEDLAFGMEYLRILSDHFGILGSFSYYEGSTDQSYLDFVDQSGAEIIHRTRLEISDLTVGVLVNITQRDKPVVPYVGAGGGLYFWRLRESGDFIDFNAFDAPIFTDTFENDGTVFGWYYLAGLEVPLSPNWSVFGEARWQEADDGLDGDFQGLGDLDLSGRRLSIGMGWSF
jgi:opacity protein-like surface antigen